MRVSVAILSYVDTVSIGITADYESVHDLDVLVEDILYGVDELSGQRQGAADGGKPGGTSAGWMIRARSGPPRPGGRWRESSGSCRAAAASAAVPAAPNSSSISSGSRLTCSGWVFR